MASSYERPDQAVLTRVEGLVRGLQDELAAWRRRALRAEGELEGLRARGGTGGGILAGEEAQQVRQRIVDLETENHLLRQRIEDALGRVNGLRSRLGFLAHQEGKPVA